MWNRPGLGLCWLNISILAPMLSIFLFTGWMEGDLSLNSFSYLRNETRVTPIKRNTVPPSARDRGGSSSSSVELQVESPLLVLAGSCWCQSAVCRVLSSLFILLLATKINQYTYLFYTAKHICYRCWCLSVWYLRVFWKIHLNKFKQNLFLQGFIWSDRYGLCHLKCSWMSSVTGFTLLINISMIYNFILFWEMWSLYIWPNIFIIFTGELNKLTETGSVRKSGWSRTENSVWHQRILWE